MLTSGIWSEAIRGWSDNAADDGDNAWKSIFMFMTGFLGIFAEPAPLVCVATVFYATLKCFVAGDFRGKPLFWLLRTFSEMSLSYDHPEYSFVFWIMCGLRLFITFAALLFWAVPSLAMECFNYGAKKCIDSQDRAEGYVRSFFGAWAVLGVLFFAACFLFHFLLPRLDVSGAGVTPSAGALRRIFFKLGCMRRNENFGDRGQRLILDSDEAVIAAYSQQSPESNPFDAKIGISDEFKGGDDEEYIDPEVLKSGKTAAL